MLKKMMSLIMAVSLTMGLGMSAYAQEAPNVETAYTVDDIKALEP